MLLKLKKVSIPKYINLRINEYDRYSKMFDQMIRVENDSDMREFLRHERRRYNRKIKRCRLVLALLA